VLVENSIINGSAIAINSGDNSSSKLTLYGYGTNATTNNNWLSLTNNLGGIIPPPLG